MLVRARAEGQDLQGRAGWGNTAQNCASSWQQPQTGAWGSPAGHYNSGWVIPPAHQGPLPPGPILSCAQLTHIAVPAVSGRGSLCWLVPLHNPAAACRLHTTIGTIFIPFLVVTGGTRVLGVEAFLPHTVM